MNGLRGGGPDVELAWYAAPKMGRNEAVVVGGLATTAFFRGSVRPCAKAW